MLQAGLGLTIHDTHIDEITAAPGWTVEHIKTTPGDIFQKREFVQTARLHLGRHTRSAGLMSRGEGPPGMITLAVPIHSASNPRICGLELSPDRVIAGVAGTEYESFGLAAFQVFFVALKADAFQQHAAILWGADWLPGLTVESLLFPNHSQRTRCVGALNRVVEFGVRHPHHLADPVVARLLEDDCLDALLGSTTPDPARFQETLSRRYQALRRAVGYIREHPTEPVSLRQLCLVTGVSDRALETAFKETLDLTPKAYITLTRLHGVRRTLCSAGPMDLSVTEVATRWGFFHLGRFSQYYRALFGESPSESLQRRACRGRLISLPVSHPPGDTGLPAELAAPCSDAIPKPEPHNSAAE